MYSDKGKILKNYVKRKIMKLHDDNNEARVKANLSIMRRGLGKHPGDIPDMWMLFFEGFPEEFLGKDGEATKEEWAAYQALALFALSQQGKDIRSQFMYEEGVGIGTAFRHIAKTDDELEAVRRRFNIILTAEDIIELSHYLRGMVQLLRSKDITMDFGELANDLFYYQFDSSRASIRLKWGQDYYRNLTKETEADKEAKNEK
jgi:CRISPR system Cascade subunit CasB